MLWSRSGNRIRELIKRVGLDSRFNLIITQENYERSSSLFFLKSRQQIYEDTVDQTTWFSSAEKQRFKTVNKTEKTPQILFPHCAWIQDFHYELEHYSGRLDAEHRGNYPLFMVHEYNSQDKDEYPIFSMEVVDEVKRSYPIT